MAVDVQITLLEAYFLGVFTGALAAAIWVRRYFSVVTVEYRDR